MNSKLIINGHSISKTQVGSYEYKVSVFQNDKFYFQFNVSLQPTGKDDILPDYQLCDKSQKVPKWINKNLKVISDSIKKSI
ncbi:hypothetical protein [Flavobacterium sp.]|uniref:hypothetical protein n=1 Tax=Flavobacterium sp. TaxID=239 RepID=UPI002615A0E4|nr:hypothetical protein [Flavobacterium sp.]